MKWVRDGGRECFGGPCRVLCSEEHGAIASRRLTGAYVRCQDSAEPVVRSDLRQALG